MAQNNKAEKASADLSKAVLRGDLKAVRALLAKGANPNVDNVGGKSLLAIAATNGWSEIVSELETAIKRTKTN